MERLIKRRQLLQIGAFGSLFGLPHLLHAAKQKLARPKSAILIFLSGGPSHIDTYDLKPDAPLEFRGEFRPINTNVPGISLCEHLPMHAKMADKFAILRAVVPPAFEEHTDAAAMTGFHPSAVKASGHPSFGAVVSKVRGSANGVPPFFSLRGRTDGTSPGLLGPALGPFTPTGPTAADLRRPAGVDSDRFANRRQLLDALDPDNSPVSEFRRQALDMVISGAVRSALDVRKEDEKTRSRFKGVEDFLVARRLIEAGAGCVTLGIDGFDTHEDNFAVLKRLLPLVDRGFCELLSDLHDRSLMEDVVVLMWGEFGRTPKITMPRVGRDHWSPVMSAVIAGGGLKMGQVIGGTDRRAEMPKDNACTVAQVLATLYKTLGIDPAMTFNDGSGRPRHILEDRETVKELL